MKALQLFALSLFTLLSSTSNCLAADGATLVFKSGQVVFLNNGYKQLSELLSKLSKKSQDHQFVELNLEGSSFLLNISEVVILCRDHCSNLEIIDVRDPARTGSANQSGSNTKSPIN